MATTTITFDEFGNMNIDAVGYTGSQCADTTAKLLEGMKAKPKAEVKKPEFFNSVQDRGRINIGR